MGHGLCCDLLDRAVIGHTVLLGAPVQKELHRIVVSKFNVPNDLWQELAARLREFEHMPSATIPLSAAVPDPDDIAILACAVAAQADVFVTGDQALLSLGKINGMPIRSPRQLWTQLLGLTQSPIQK